MDRLKWFQIRSNSQRFQSEWMSFTAVDVSIHINLNYVFQMFIVNLIRSNAYKSISSNFSYDQFHNTLKSKECRLLSYLRSFQSTSMHIFSPVLRVKLHRISGNLNFLKNIYLVLFPTEFSFFKVFIDFLYRSC